MDYSKLRESSTLEFKEVPVTEREKKKFKSYLKTVSAFANYQTGRIIFGISDDGSLKPVPDLKNFVLNLENQIHDSIDPIPDYSITENEDQTVTLTVKRGSDTPYLYDGKAYRRQDSSSLPVDRTAFKKLSLKGSNLTFECLECSRKDLTFNSLSKWMNDKIGLDFENPNTLRSYSLYSTETGYTNGALLLSDQNTFLTADLVYFGDSEDEIRRRTEFTGESILDTYDQINKLFIEEYSYEKIGKITRSFELRIPENAFHEALANALVHRDWMIRSAIQIGFYKDHISIISPGGLPYGISESEYLNQKISVPTNFNIAYIFSLLGIIERFGTGIQRIRKAYETYTVKPKFVITENSISVELPFIKTEESLSEEENQILSLLKNENKTRADLLKATGMSQYYLSKVLKSLEQKGLIQKKGKTRRTVYSLVK